MWSGRPRSPCFEAGEQRVHIAGHTEFGTHGERLQRRSAAQTREHMLAVAHELFYWHGVRAIGVDKVAAEAGIAPTTLYRLFASKDDLVAAYVDRAARRYRDWFTAATAVDGRGPRQRILALFDALADQVQPDRCRGCHSSWRCPRLLTPACPRTATPWP